MKHLFGMLTARLFFSHILVAMLTGMVVSSTMLIIIWFANRSIQADAYESVAFSYGAMWMFGIPDGEANIPMIDPMAGWTLVLSPDDEVLWSRGDTTCRAGMPIAECEPGVNLEIGSRFFDRSGERWAETVVETVTDARVVMHRGPSTAEPFLLIGDWLIYGYRDMLVFEIGAMGLLGIPVALAFAWLIARPQIRRLSAIAQTSRRFAEGELDTRVRDHRSDEIGRLSQQVDDMADTLKGSVIGLRDLAQRNAELAAQAEQAAIQAERNRLSRDLHDAIAQRLFSLSMSTTTLPEIIARDQARGIQQANAIAELAEQTLLDLRALLVDLRPSSVVEQGLYDAIKSLCSQQQIECSVILSGSRIPTVIEDAIYRIAQEALNNAVKHANAGVIELSLVEGQRQIILSVTDDGTGFDPAVAGSNGKFGLISMRERAASVGGKLVIEGERGTTVQATLPLYREGST